jgi:hypothetical protein
MSLTVLGTIAACHRGQGVVKQPTINASSAARGAIEGLDKNGDGQLSADELEPSASLKSALSRLDANTDKSVTADEIANRIKTWQGMRTGLTSFAFSVTLDGAPLTDATVTFEPESFLGSDIKAAVATTNASGRGRPSIPPEQRPDPTWPSGIQIGLYRVKISKMVGGKEIIPAKYNVNTTIGQEVAPDVPEIAGNRVVYALTSK